MHHVVNPSRVKPTEYITISWKTPRNDEWSIGGNGSIRTWRAIDDLASHEMDAIAWFELDGNIACEVVLALRVEGVEPK